MTDFTLATADFETDPFLEYRVPEPFCCGLYDGTIYTDFWGKDCVAQFIRYLESLEEKLLIYFHNGGGFDFWFLIWFADEGSIQVLNGKVVKFRIAGHEFRDSFKILPFGLDKYQKDKIDYAKFEAKVRAKHKKEILAYQKKRLPLSL